MKKSLTVCVCLLILVSCQREVSLDNSTSQILNLDTASIASNIGIYKGVFTTLDSKERATVEITITDATRFASTYGNRATAVLNFEKGNTVTATAVRAIELGESIQDLVFESPELTFVFSVENDGNSPTISNVSYNNTPSDILIVKHSTRNPVNPVLGTFICTGCNGNTTVTNAVSQTFNMTLTAGVVATQAVVDGSSYLGDGLEATSADNGDGTSSAAVSGSVTTPDSTVDFTGTHTFSTTGDDCSEVTGTWTWNTNGVTGTFESDTSCGTTSVVLLDYDFNAFNGSGFSPTPSAGQLDSNVIIANGFSGSLNFGGTSPTTGDYARGIKGAGQSTGGIYAFILDGIGNVGIGVQPGGSDFTPGEFDLKIENTSGTTLTSINVNYDVYVNNDQGRSNSLNFSYSTDNVTYISEPSLDFVSAVASDNLGFIFENRNIEIAVTIPTGSYLYIRFEGNDVSGSGSRDEFAIDNVIVTGN
tara:strand:- start:51 stop:1478 length:1428 start_codon:yes stop_codon:yes gene_type:complete